MTKELTPAVTRILASLRPHAQAGQGGYAVPQQVLLGLLSESECRAALTLARHSVTEDDVIARWPELAEIADVVPSTSLPAVKNGPTDNPEIGGDVSSSGLCSDPNLQVIIARAGELLADFPQPLAVATEHVLLGLVAGDDDAATWLRERGLSQEAMLAELRQQFGVDATPLSVSLEGEPQVEASASTVSESPEATSAAAPEEFDDEIAAYLSDGGRGVSDGAARSSQLELPSSPGQGSPPPRMAVFRVLDAAINRALEGLRVLEDSARFLLNDANLTLALKDLRHGVSGLAARLPQDALIAARDVPGDVGTPLSTLAERSRHTTEDLLAANFHRVQESLRSLEEFGKLVDTEASVSFKHLRYECYTLHRSAMVARQANHALETARLYVLLDGGSSPQAFEHLSKSLIDVGVPLMQFRDKQLCDRELLDRAGELMRYALGTDTRVIINDRPDIAAAVSADGVHLGQEELTSGAARRTVGPEALIGISTHNLDQAKQAARDGASYLGVGPTFPSRTKEFEEFPGLEFAHAVATEVALPAYAIGGITLANLESVLKTGVHGVAIGAAITSADDPPRAVKEFLRVLN
ncbi:MAG: thiamine phosphate synthase [Pirellulales bacterium]|nr:thiamine phosphate synthase [Pirellulales bacterium]